MPVVFVVLALAAGCARQPRPAVTPRPPSAPAAGVPALQADLASCFTTPAFSHAIWGVLVRSLWTGETLFAQNATTLLMPASSMKIVTMAAAAERLGWGYTFQTTVMATGPIDRGVLEGDLVVIGGGDPSLGGRPASDMPVLDAWAEQLRQQGVTSIEGRIVGDDNAFDDQGLGAGWAWDYLADGYATPVGALDFNENVVQIGLKPGLAEGDPAAIDVQPEGAGLVIDSAVRTVAGGGTLDIALSRLPGSRVLHLTGTLPIDRTDVTRTASVDNPTGLLVGALRLKLAEKGIAVTGDAVDIDALPSPPDMTGARTLATHTSPPLSQIGAVMLKESQNLYAETLLRTLGRTAGPEPATAKAGLQVIRDVLKAWGIGPDRYIMVDGSGLSRYNYVTPEILVLVLEHVIADGRLREPFEDALPVAGVDGTIARRMKGTIAEGNARAKTGSISNARSLSGYVTSADGEPLVFSMIVNNFTVRQAEADAIIDQAVVRLAAFRRREGPRSTR